MERYHKIMKHHTFIEYVNRIEQVEKDRIYCRHNIGHLLDVARIGYLHILEEGLPIEKDLFYAAALLHDIGKVDQYVKKIPHEIGGAEIAAEVLKDCGYEKEEIEMIRQAILRHRRGDHQEENILADTLYRADKESRLCMFCKVSDSCNWTKEEKNDTLLF